MGKFVVPITRRLDRIYRAKAHDLYELLFPQEIPDTIEELIVVADGPLLGLPFEALLREASKAGQPDHELPYLIRDYGIYYSPSMNMLYRSEESHGKEKPNVGMDIVGFAPIFFEDQLLPTGADKLIVSLWSVQDQATAYLMEELYSELLLEEAPQFATVDNFDSETETVVNSKATYLRKSKLKLIDSQQWAHPFYWSAFVLIGG